MDSLLFLLSKITASHVSAFADVVVALCALGALGAWRKQKRAEIIAEYYTRLFRFMHSIRASRSVVNIINALNHVSGDINAYDGKFHSTYLSETKAALDKAIDDMPLVAPLALKVKAHFGKKGIIYSEFYNALQQKLELLVSSLHFMQTPLFAVQSVETKRKVINTLWGTENDELEKEIVKIIQDAEKALLGISKV